VHVMKLMIEEHYRGGTWEELPWRRWGGNATRIGIATMVRRHRRLQNSRKQRFSCSALLPKLREVPARELPQYELARSQRRAANR
jgi:hypothetical protein